MQIDFVVKFYTTDLMQNNDYIAEFVECVELRMHYFRALDNSLNVIQLLVTNVGSHFDSCVTNNL